MTARGRGAPAAGRPTVAGGPRPPRAVLRAALLLAAVAGCGLPEPERMVRVTGGEPAGEGVDPSAAAAVRFSGAVSAEELLDGRRLLLVEARDLPAALDAVESEGGADAATPRIAAEIGLADGATRATLRPLAPLPGGRGFAVVASSRLRDAQGRRVLDGQGRLRPTVLAFTTAFPPPPAVLVTEVRADAAAPEAGGEYVEVANLGPGDLDLAGWRLEKRAAGGAWSGCTAAPGAAVAPPGGAALLVGGAWDGRYALPGPVAIFACGAAALAGGIANDRAPVLRLLDPAGREASAFDGAPAWPCAGALERALGAPGVLACTAGTPGAAW